ncbi:MAG: phosphate acyltransferase PlsX [Pseudomonadota bacterium]
MDTDSRLVIDAMGGDGGVEVVAEAAVSALERHPRLQLCLTGDRDAVTQALGAQATHPRVRIVHTTQTVAMDEAPALALRGKKDSSMRVALNLVKAGEADACVSAGNTGALMATARFVLKTLPGIDRPALCTSLPAANGHTHMLDLGANLGFDADNLFQLAVMGAELVSAVDAMDAPRVGLLNVGSEELKGLEAVREAGRMLAASDLNYIGFVEGNDIFSERVDVIVCDGFTGNVALKTAEGAARFVVSTVKRVFGRSWYGRLAGAVALPLLRAVSREIDPDRHNGASMLGINGIVIKSHGGANARAFGRAIDLAVLEAANKVPDKIHQRLAVRQQARTGTA